MLGKTIGSYCVRAKVGEGGMGTVYLAEHTELGRQVAIKVLLPEMSHDRSIVNRFFNEARSASTIHHPSIVEIYDFGYTADGHAYIVMEYLEGETLGNRRRRFGRIDLRRALQITRQIAVALGAAHERGIIHRDLKPDNVFLVPDPEVAGGERIKLLDFGIAKLQGSGSDISHTQTGSVLGTPAYMAPEQCRGSGVIDARADLYALGCVLYELLLGRPPFTADGAGDLIAHHLYFEPPPPREIDPSLPQAVDELVRWLLRKDPAHRPQNAKELIAAIDAVDVDGGESAHKASPVAVVPAAKAAPTTLSGASGERSNAPTSRRWLVVPAVALTTIAAGIAVYFAIASHGDEPSPSSDTKVVAPVTTVAKQDPATTPATTPAAPHAVKLTIESDPAGATVLRNGTPVGKTPYVDSVAPGTAEHGPRTYAVRKDGYENATATLRIDRDGSEKVVLKKKKARVVRTHEVGDQGVNPFD